MSQVKCTVEIEPYANAPWAPEMKNAKWAWRVTTNNNNRVTGATAKTKAEAKRIAKASVNYMKAMNRSKLPEFSRRFSV